MVVIILIEIRAEKHILVSGGQLSSVTRGNTWGPQHGSGQGFGERTGQAVTWNFLPSRLAPGETVP